MAEKRKGGRWRTSDRPVPSMPKGWEQSVAAMWAQQKGWERAVEGLLVMAMERLNSRLP